MSRFSKMEHMLAVAANNYLVYTGVLMAIFIISLASSSQSFALQYSNYTNYTSDKYQIQFQYPSDWQLKEKTNRFEEGTDISVSKIGFDYPGLIGVGYNTDLVSGFGSADFTTAFYETFKSAIGSDYSKGYRVIEQPSFINIDGQKAGTFVYTWKDKYEDSPTVYAVQDWLVFVGNHGYLLGFFSPTTYFDSPENTEIRDQFIKSINFLGAENATNTNVTNRFN